MSCQSTILLKVEPFAILNLLLETNDHIQDVQVLMQLLLDTLMMEAELELDSHQDPEKQFLATAEPQLVLLLVEVEMKNPS
jgi:hypothetical protein